MGHTRIVGGDDSRSVSVTSTGALAVNSDAVAMDSANIVAGTGVATNTTSASTVLTIPAGRQFVGEVVLSIASTAAAIVAATVQVVGTNAIPATTTVVARVNIGGLTSGGFSAAATFKVRCQAPVGNSISLHLINSSAANNTSSATANGILI